LTDILLVGRSREALVFARDVGCTPAAMVDPRHPARQWLDLPAFQRDEDAIGAVRFRRVILAIDAPAARARAFDLYAKAGLEFVDLCASRPGDGTVHGRSLFLQRLANLSVDCRIGDGVRINVGANVMHDVSLDDFVTVAPNAVLLARVRVGRYSYVGAGAVILPGVSVGKDCMVGAGAVVTHNIADGQTVKGAPAR
jgi:sugar O-acyltransferase (sialic acid O-acetyltransferase NeuD family)